LTCALSPVPQRCSIRLPVKFFAPPKALSFAQPRPVFRGELAPLREPRKPELRTQFPAARRRRSKSCYLPLVR
jgi:hypothetical protein